MTKPTETLKLKVQSLKDQISTLIGVISEQNKKIDKLEKIVLSLSQTNFESSVPEQKPKFKYSRLIDEIRSLMVCPDCSENNLDVRRNKTTNARFVIKDG